MTKNILIAALLAIGLSATAISSEAAVEKKQVCKVVKGKKVCKLIKVHKKIDNATKVPEPVKKAKKKPAAKKKK